MGGVSSEIFFYLTGDGSRLRLGLNLSPQAPEYKLTLTAKLADLRHKELKTDRA